MAKSKNRRKNGTVAKRKISGKKKSGNFDEEAFWERIDERIHRSFVNLIQGVEAKLENLQAELENAKGNIIVTNTLLEKKNILKQEEFFEEYQRYIEEQQGGVDGSGQMDGKAIMSLYNCGG